MWYAQAAGPLGEVVSFQSKDVVSGKLSQYASKLLFRVGGPSWDSVPKGWTRRGTVIVYEATYSPLSLVLRSFPSAIRKENVRTLGVYFGKDEKTGLCHYWVVDDNTPRMRIQYSGNGDLGAAMQYLFEKHRGSWDASPGGS